MTFLPIVDRELRAASRKRSTFWTRFFIALVVIAVFFVMIWSARPSRGISNLGQNLFNALSTISFAYALLVGVFFTADCLSSERREGTLGLLFLTDLKGHDVVLGKVVASSLTSFYGLLAVFPVLALPLLLGGVTGAEFWRMAFALVIILLFSLAIGAVVSAFARDEWQAMVATFLVILFFTGVLPAIWGLGKELLKAPFFATSLSKTIFLMPSPGSAMMGAFDSNFKSRSGAEMYWSAIQTLSVLASVSIGLACFILPRSWQGRSKVMKCLAIAPDRRNEKRRRLLEHNPFFWLMSRWKGQRVLFLTVFLLGFSILAGMLYSSYFEKYISWQFAVATYGAFGLHLLTKIFIAITACRRLHQDRGIGALELILATPLPVEDIVSGQKRALARQFLLPMLMLVVFNVALLIVQTKVEPDKELTSMFVLVALGGSATLLVDFFALIRVAMWQGLVTKRFGVAVLVTTAKVLVIPWLSIFIFIFVGSAGGMSFDAVMTFAVIFVLFSLVLSGVIGARNERKLVDNFRLAAAGLHKTVKPGSAS